MPSKRRTEQARTWGRMIRDRALERIGKRGWRYLSNEQRTAAIAREAMFVLLGQADETLDRNPLGRELAEAFRLALEKEDL